MLMNSEGMEPTADEIDNIKDALDDDEAGGGGLKSAGD